MDRDVGRDRSSESELDSAASERLSELRKILVGPETSAIQEIEKKLESSTFHVEHVSRVLPRAIRLRSETDNRLTSALDDTVGEILTTSVRRNPKMLANALFPIMGPAIRASIVSTLREMLSSFEKTLNHSLSPRSIGWRIEAYRTQRSFSEVVLLHSIHYRVEQIFLVHQDSGLLLQHAVGLDAPSASPDMISAMLTAIQDFVKDSFGVGSEGGLNSLEVGELSIWIERGPSAIVAAVIRGNASSSIRDCLRSVLETIHQELPEELENFSGDTTPFEAFQPDLEACLTTELKEDHPSGRISWVWSAVAVLLVGLVAYWVFAGWQNSKQLRDLTRLLEKEPGIVVTKVAREDGRIHLFGLRDPLSTDPAGVAEKLGIPPDRIASHWELYYALSPALVNRRAADLLQPPESVTLSLDGGLLKASGSASSDWIQRADRLAPSIPGISRWDRQGLSDEGQAELRQRVESSSLRFVFRDRLAADQSASLRQLAEDLGSLQKLAEENSQTIRLHVTGVTDEPGSDRLNEGVGLSRARVVQQELRTRGLRESNLEWSLEHRQGSVRAVELRMEFIQRN